MTSVRKGLRSGDIEKDNYERLRCSACEEPLTTENDPEEIGKVRVCPECGREWEELG
jgi:NAD-dependent SIR2 family protein deacetylase